MEHLQIAYDLLLIMIGLAVLLRCSGSLAHKINPD